MKKYYKKFTSKKEMVEKLSSLSEVFDTKAMVEKLAKAGPRRLFIITSDGKEFACDNFKKFVSIISTKGDLELLYPICFGRGEVYHVFSKVDYFNKEDVEKEISVDAQLKPVEDTEIKELSEEVVEVKDSLSEIQTEDSKKLDLSKYEELYDSKDIRGCKDELERVVKEEHGIDLRKNQKFEGMIEELREALEE